MNLVQRIEGIKLIYENLEADDDNNNWNKNLIQDSFNQDSVILINQISAENSNKNDETSFGRVREEDYHKVCTQFKFSVLFVTFHNVCTLFVSCCHFSLLSYLSHTFRHYS